MTLMLSSLEPVRNDAAVLPHMRIFCESSADQCMYACAGVVGLAIARALALSGREVIVLESENAIGTSTSARNSEVVHSGEASQARHNQVQVSYQPHEILRSSLKIVMMHVQASTIPRAA